MAIPPSTIQPRTVPSGPRESQDLKVKTGGRPAPLNNAAMADAPNNS